MTELREAQRASKAALWGKVVGRLSPRSIARLGRLFDGAAPSAALMASATLSWMSAHQRPPGQRRLLHVRAEQLCPLRWKRRVSLACPCQGLESDERSRVTSLGMAVFVLGMKGTGT